MLESFLKGEHNDAQEIVSEFELKMHSIYILIADELNDEKILESDPADLFQLREFRISEDIRVKTKKIQAELETLMNRYNQDYISPQGIIGSPILEEEKFDSAHSKEQSRSNVFDDFLPRASKRFSVHPKPNIDPIDPNNLSESFKDHMRDIDREYDLENRESAGENRKSGASIYSAESDHQISHWWNQRLILLIEILDISSKVWIYRNGKMKGVEQQPSAIKSIMISTPLNITKAWENKVKRTENYTELSALDYDNLLTNIMNYDFKSIEEKTNPMAEFLSNNGCDNYVQFIYLFLRYSRMRIIALNLILIYLVIGTGLQLEKISLFQTRTIISLFTVTTTLGF